MRTVQRGFTLIEIMITLVIVVILTSLGIVAFGDLQTQARDEEREADIAAIQRGLEQYYKSGDSRVVGAETKGTYPGTRDFMHLTGLSMCNVNGGTTAYYTSGQCHVTSGYESEVLPGVSDDVLTAPNTSTQLTTNWSCDDSCLQGKVTNDGVYAYRPYNSVTSGDPNGYCYHNCPRYQLWYEQEATGDIIVVKSKFE